MKSSRPALVRPFVSVRMPWVRAGGDHQVFFAGFVHLDQSLLEVFRVDGRRRAVAAPNILPGRFQPVLRFVMVHNDQGGDFGFLQAFYDLLGGCPLVVHIDGPCVSAAVDGTVESHQFDAEQFYQRDVLLVTDFAAVDDVAIDMKRGTDELMGKCGRDCVGIGKVLQHDDVLLAFMGLEKLADRRLTGGIFYCIGLFYNFHVSLHEIR